MDRPPRLSSLPAGPFQDVRRLRSILTQVALVSFIALIVWGAGRNALFNMHARGIPTGLAFWNNPAGFNIDQTLIGFDAAGSTYGDAFFVGLLNTLLVAALGIVGATIFSASRSAWDGFPAMCWWRNPPRSMSRPFATYRCCCSFCSGTTRFSNHCPIRANPSRFSAASSSTTVASSWRSRPSASAPAGSAPPFSWASQLRFSGSLVRGASSAGPARRRPFFDLYCACLGPADPRLFPERAPDGIDYPTLRGFNFVGGMRVLPELVALLLGLTIYTASFIAEVVRSGILAVDKGQLEAAGAWACRAARRCV